MPSKRSARNAYRWSPTTPTRCVMPGPLALSPRVAELCVGIVLP
jgi:hypothetical protein